MVVDEDYDYGDPAESDDEEIPYLTYHVITFPSDLTLQVLSDMWKSKDILIPEYQRNYVWNQKQASLLIDSFLTGLPVPPLFFYRDEDDKFQVIDGQQRLTSIIYYLEGFFGPERQNGNRKIFRLTGLSDQAPWAGKSFTELGPKDQRRLRSSVIRAMNVQQTQPDDNGSSAYYIFERLNTGGTRLSSQEIRNVVYRGPFNDGLKELNRNHSWREILGKPNEDRRQKDTELVLRVFALSYYLDQYEKPLTNFLNKVIRENQKTQIESVHNFQTAFVRAVNIVCTEFGSKPFHPRGRLNVATLDSVLSVLIGKYDELDLENLAAQWQRLKEDPTFIETTTKNTTDEKTVQLRIRTVLQYFSKD